MARLFAIEEITEDQEARLRSLGISSLHGLLTAASTKKKRERLAKKSGVPERKILEWVILAELMQVCGVGETAAILLRDAGVTSIEQLAQNRGNNLFGKLQEVNNRKGLFRRVPSERVLRKWISRARRMESVLEG